MTGSVKTTKVILTAEVAPYKKGFTEASTVTTKFGKDIEGVNAKSKGMEAQMSKTGGALKGVALGAGALAGTALVSFLGDSVKAAGDLQQSIGGVDSVFKDSAETVHAFGKTSAEAVGLSRNEFNQLITVTGAMLKNKGLEDFANKSLDLVKIGADLAAQFGGSTKDAVDAVNAAMRGESDPIERYGISLNETAVNAELASKGLGKLTGTALDQAKAQARIDIITRQSADALGAFGREADTLQGQQQRLNAEWEDAKAQLGGALLPALTAVTEALRGGLDLAVASASAWEDIPGPIKAAAGALVLFHLAQKPVGAGLESMRGGIQRVRDEMALQQALASGITGGYQKLGDEAKVSGEKMTRTSTAMAVGAKVAKGAGSALLGAFGGPLGLAITGITFALGGFIQAQADARAAAKELADTLDKQTGKFTENTRESFAKKVFGDFNEVDFAKVRDSLDSAGVGIADLIAAYEQGGPAVDEFKRKFDAWQADARASGGPHSKLAADAERIGNAYESVGTDMDAARIVFDETGKVQEKVAKSTGQMADAAADAPPKVDLMTKALEASKTASDEAAKAAKDVAEAYLAISDAAVSADEAEAGYQAALDDATKAIEENGRTTNKARTELNLNTEAGRANQEALVGIRDKAIEVAKANIEQGDSVASVKAKMDAAETAFVTAAKKMGLSEAAAKKMAKEYGLTDGTVDGLKDSLDSVKGTYAATVKVNGVAEAKARLAELQAAIARSLSTPGVIYGSIANAVRQADGGPVPGSSPHDRADNIHVMATADEYMIRRSSARKLGRATLDYINTTGTLPAQRLADGGFVSRMPAPSVAMSSGLTEADVVSILRRLPRAVSVYSGEDSKSAARTAIRDDHWRMRHG